MMARYICVDCERGFTNDTLPDDFVENGQCPDCGGWVTGVDYGHYDTLEEKAL